MKTEVVQINELIEELRNNISIPENVSYQCCTHCDYCEFVDLEWEDLDIESTDFNTLAETLYYKLGYRKIDKNQQVVDTEYLTKLESKHNEIRREVAKEIIQDWYDDAKLVGLGKLELHNIAQYGKREYGVEIKQ